MEEEAAEAAEAVKEAEVEAEVEAVEEDLPHHHSTLNSNRMLHQLEMLKQWENSLTHLTVTVQKQKTSLKKSKDTSVLYPHVSGLHQDRKVFCSLFMTACVPCL